MTGDTDEIEVRCDLEAYEDLPEWPPVDQEYLTCRRLSSSEAEVLNSPFFVDDLALGDVIRFEDEGTDLGYRGVAEDRGNSTLQLVYSDLSVDEARAMVTALGCSAESAERFKLLSVVVPADVSYADVYNALAERAEAEQSFDFREAKVSEIHRKERPPLLEGGGT